jgi:Iron only hydrogenase large subunit, C-terminal domain
MGADGTRDVDIVVTAVEAAAALRERGVDLFALEPIPFDDPLGTSGGGAQLFGTTGACARGTAVDVLCGARAGRLPFGQLCACVLSQWYGEQQPDTRALLHGRTAMRDAPRRAASPLTRPRRRCAGGVMEAAVRTVYKLVTGRRLGKLELEAVRGLEAFRKCDLEMTPSEDGALGLALRQAGCSGPLTLSVGVVNGLGEAKKVVKAVQDGSLKVDFVEVMACPGGASPQHAAPAV